MLIAHVLSSLRIGGGERVALELAAGQVRAGHDVTVVSLAPEPDGPLADEFRARRVAVERVAKGAGVEPTLPLRLAQVLRRHRVQIVHTHNRLPLMYGAFAGRLAGARVIHTRHGPGRGTRRESFLRRAAGRLLDAYVGVSPELAALAREVHDCAPARISVIENGIDLERFRADPEARLRTRAALGIPERAVVFGSVGRLAVEKDYPMLIRAAAPLLGEETRLMIVGDGDDLPAIRGEISRLGLERFVILPGATAEVPRYMAALDVFVLSSRMEGLPLVSLEAMAFGLPIVATAVGGLPALITDGVTGYLVPPRDEVSMREKLRGLREGLADTGAVAARGRDHVRQRYSRESMLASYQTLYERALGRGRP